MSLTPVVTVSTSSVYLASAFACVLTHIDFCAGSEDFLRVCAAFLNMLCSLKWGIYVFFGFWQFVAIFFTYFLVPETRGVPIEEVFWLHPLLFIICS